MKRLQTLIISSIFTAFVCVATWMMSGGQAFAVTVKNGGSEAQTLQITENGERRDVTLAASSEVEICPQGCFISFGTGDILAVQGPETVLIEAGKVRIIAR